MTRFLPTFLALAVLAGLGYYVWKYEQEPMADKSVPKVAVTDRAQIARVELEDTAKKTKVTLEKGKDDKWQVTAPLKAKPDDEKIDSLLTRLEKVKADRIVDGDVVGQKADLTKYGLDTPSHKATWLAGDKSATILIGKDNPLGSSAYVKLADDEKVFLVNSGDLEILKKDLYTFRDKTVLKADKDQVKQLTVTKSSGEKWQFAQGQDGTWTIEVPFKAPGDSQIVGDMAGDLGRLRAEEFTAETTSDLKPYGLDKPDLTAQLVMKEDGATKTVQFGLRKPSDSSRVYAKRENEPNVYLVDAALIKALGNKIDEFRDKTVLRTADREFAALSVEKGGETISAQRAKDGKWSYEASRLTSDPGSAGTQLLEKLRDLKAARFIPAADVKPADFGLDKPEYTLRVSLAPKAATTATTGAKAEPAVELVARVGKPIEGGRYLKLENDPVAVVTKEDFTSALEQFIKVYREILPIEEWNLKTIEISAKDRKESYEINDKGDWVKAGQKEAVAGLKDKIRALASTLPHLAANGWLPESKDALKEVGLDQPAVSLVVKTKDGKPDTSLALSQAGGKHYVKLAGKLGFGLIGPELLARSSDTLAADTGKPAAPAAPATGTSTATTGTAQPAAPVTTATTK